MGRCRVEGVGVQCMVLTNEAGEYALTRSCSTVDVRRREVRCGKEGILRPRGVSVLLCLSLYFLAATLVDDPSSTFRTRSANLSEQIDSEESFFTGDTWTNISVFEFELRESWSRYVNAESRYGT